MSTRSEDRMRRAAYPLPPGISYEQLPRPLVEAFAHGLPAIASRVERLAEMVEPGRNGIVRFDDAYERGVEGVLPFFTTPSAR